MAGDSSDGQKGKSKIEVFQIVVGVILSVVAGISAYTLNQTEKTLKNTEVSLKEVEKNVRSSQETRAERESIEKIQLLVYEAVVKSLESGDAKRQAVSKALVTSMLKLNDPLRSNLLSVLTTSASPEIRKDAQITLNMENKYFNDQKAVVQPSAKKSSNNGWENWDIDFFWCERSGTFAKNIAERMKNQIKSEGAKGRLRVRMLPDSINTQPGYQNTGYVIRYNKTEEKIANELKALGNKIVSPSEFEARLSNQSTLWYLSAFACPDTP